MAYQWEPGTEYQLGAVVVYQGHRYKIIQPHTSQANWTPPATPALWARLPEIASSDPGQQPQYGQQQTSGDQGSSFGAEEKPWHEQHSQKVEIPHGEQQKHWYDLDDKRKKEIEIGGGLAAGLALLGAGYYAYHEHEKNDEQKKAQVWGLQRWIQDAQARAEQFHTYGFKGPLTWILVHGKNIPKNAILGGEVNGQAVYIARAFHEGGIQIGKAGSQFDKGAVIGFKHKEIQLDVYEVLIGDSRAIKWVDARGHLKPTQLGHRLVEGGHEDNGSLLYVAQADHKGSVWPGKASEVLDGAYFTCCGREEREKVYRVLAYA